MKRRNLLLLPLLGAIPRAWSASETSFVLYRDAANPLVGPSSAAWAWPGNALTASTQWIYSVAMENVLYARWVCVWAPRSAGSGVRLVVADSGPSNIQEIASFVSPTDYPNPRNDAAEVTLALRGIVQDQQIGHQMKGPGNCCGPLVYGSWVEVLWG